jgi:hypothetical protein
MARIPQAADMMNMNMNSTGVNKDLLIIQFFIAKYLFLNVKSRYCLWVEVYVRSEVTFL